MSSDSALGTVRLWYTESVIQNVYITGSGQGSREYRIQTKFHSRRVYISMGVTIEYYFLSNHHHD